MDHLVFNVTYVIGHLQGVKLCVNYNHEHTHYA